MGFVLKISVSIIPNAKILCLVAGESEGRGLTDKVGGDRLSHR